MELFEINEQVKNPTRKEMPLYARLRPLDFSDFIIPKGLEPFVDLINKDELPSLILWGPPGSGKTTFAHIIKNKTQKDFVFLSAVLSGVKELRETVERAEHNKKFRGKQTLLFVDEIHRFNKAQQDAILPHLETGIFVLIGATTENPSFEVIPALLSRCKVIRFDAIEKKGLITIIKQIIAKEGLVDRINDDAVEAICEISLGDARFAINLLETCISNVDNIITKEKVIELLGSTHIKYDKTREDHYNYISAFIKSIRGSSADAAIYYLARMLESGEDPKFIVRRLIILASEDVGNADPRALELAVTGLNAVHNIGMPEARIILAQITTYLATAPKSNASYLAIDAAISDIRNGLVFPPPMHLRNAITKLMKDSGYGDGYKYAHDFEGHIVKQDYLPKELKDKSYYNPTTNGYEKTISERLKFWEEQKK